MNSAPPTPPRPSPFRPLDGFDFLATASTPIVDKENNQQDGRRQGGSVSGAERRVAAAPHTTGKLGASAAASLRGPPSPSRGFFSPRRKKRPASASRASPCLAYSWARAAPSSLFAGGPRRSAPAAPAPSPSFAYGGGVRCGAGPPSEDFEDDPLAVDGEWALRSSSSWSHPGEGHGGPTHPRSANPVARTLWNEADRVGFEEEEEEQESSPIDGLVHLYPDEDEPDAGPWSELLRGESGGSAAADEAPAAAARLLQVTSADLSGRPRSSSSLPGGGTGGGIHRPRPKRPRLSTP